MESVNISLSRDAVWRESTNRNCFAFFWTLYYLPIDIYQVEYSNSSCIMSIKGCGTDGHFGTLQNIDWLIQVLPLGMWKNKWQQYFTYLSPSSMLVGMRKRMIHGNTPTNSHWIPNNSGNPGRTKTATKQTTSPSPMTATTRHGTGQNEWKWKNKMDEHNTKNPLSIPTSGNPIFS